MSSLALGQALEQGRERLSASGILPAQREAEALLEHILGVSRSQLWSSKEREMGSGDLAAFDALLSRRCGREPLQLILGQWEFMGRTLEMAQGVFVPRPQTEALVQASLDRLAAMDSPEAHLLDLGTGSGAILASLMALSPRPLRGLGVDRDLAACCLALRNVRPFRGRAHVVQASWTSFLSQDQLWDLVVSNPPYLDEALAGHLDQEIDWDPKGALYSPQHGMEDLLLLLEKVPAVLGRGGWFLFECGPDKANTLGADFPAGPWKSRQPVLDISGELQGWALEKE